MNNKLRARVVELEAERRALNEMLDAEKTIAANAVRSIEAKTIERCAQSVEWFRNVHVWGITDVIARIRALKPAAKEN